MLLLIILYLISLTSTAEPNMELLKVAIIARNGPDTPKTLLYDELQFARPNQENTLTRTGERMMYNLGTHFRKTYPNLIKNTTILRVFTSHSKNIMMSAFSLYNGLKGPNTGGNVTEHEHLSPPFKGQSYTFNNKSALPFSLNIPLLSSFDRKNEPLFESDLREACPELFAIVSNTSSIQQDNTTKNLQDYDLEFENLREELRKAGVNPRGARADKGWDSVNLEEFFDVAESHLYNTEKQFADIPNDVYNSLWLYKSFATELQYFDQFYKFAPIWTNNIMNSTIRNFVSGPDEEKIRVYMTDGRQLYAFLRLLKFASKDCLLSVNNGTREYPYPIGVEKPHQSEHCYMYPRYGAHIAFEYSRNTQNNFTYVRVLFNGEPVDVGCVDQLEGYYCEMVNFRNHLYFTLFGFDYLKMCKSRKIPIFESITFHTTRRDEFKWIALGSIILACLTWALGMYFKYLNDKSERIDKRLDEVGLGHRKVELRRRQKKKTIGEVNNSIEFNTENLEQNKKEEIELSFDNDEPKKEYELDRI